jgi:hypothetical protein
MLYQWVVLVHILGVFGFLLAHGTAAAVSFKLRGEREVARVRALLDLSRSVTVVGRVSLLVLLAAGIGLGFRGNWWGQGWIWASLGLFVLISIVMGALGTRSFSRIRALVQTSDLTSGTPEVQSAQATATEKQLAAMVSAIHPWPLTVIGGGGLALILWLMMFKPF